jgi:hypothetical protein
MAVRTTAGSTLKVSASAPATYNTAGYAALTWTSVGEVTDLGEFGREYTLVTHNPINNRITQKFKGSYNEGKMSLKLGLDTDDAGQVLMKAASLSPFWSAPIRLKSPTKRETSITSPRWSCRGRLALPPLIRSPPRRATLN